MMNTISNSILEKDSFGNGYNIVRNFIAEETPHKRKHQIGTGLSFHYLLETQEPAQNIKDIAQFNAKEVQFIKRILDSKPHAGIIVSSFSL